MEIELLKVLKNQQMQSSKKHLFFNLTVWRGLLTH